MPGVVSSTTGGASQYSGAFGIAVSGGGATLEYLADHGARRVEDRQRQGPVTCAVRW